jgi:hypothetical protein
MFAASVVLYALSFASAADLSVTMLESRRVDVDSQPAITTWVLLLDALVREASGLQATARGSTTISECNFTMLLRLPNWRFYCVPLRAQYTSPALPCQFSIRTSYHEMCGLLECYSDRSVLAGFSRDARR